LIIFNNFFTFLMFIFWNNQFIWKLKLLNQSINVCDHAWYNLNTLECVKRLQRPCNGLKIAHARGLAPACTDTGANARRCENHAFLRSGGRCCHLGMLISTTVVEIVSYIPYEYVRQILCNAYVWKYYFNRDTSCSKP